MNPVRDNNKNLYSIKRTSVSNGMRIIIDSSVWIAGIGSKKGYASEIIFKSSKTAEIEIYISSQILAEVKNNLIEKLKFDELLANRAQKTVRNLCDYEVDIFLQDEKKIKYSFDKHILLLCQKVQADYLITFDRKHLLSLNKFGRTIILEPKEFRKLLD